jgi:hypothetical protein
VTMMREGVERERSGGELNDSDSDAVKHKT